MLAIPLIEGISATVSRVSMNPKSMSAASRGLTKRVDTGSVLSVMATHFHLALRLSLLPGLLA